MALIPAAASGPGIFWANSGVLPQYKDLLPYSTYVQFYENVHIPDWMGAKAGAITAAWRYQALDPNRDTPFLVAYKYPNISAMSSPEFRTVNLTHPSIPDGQPFTKYVQFKAMSGPHIETWKSGSTGDERGPLLVAEAIDPADNTTEAFNTWYRSTYITELSQMGGWRRTSRFDTGTTGGPAARNGGQPRWLALHEFEEWAFDENATTIPSLLGQSKETKDIQKSAKRLDLSLWKLKRVYGDGAAPWGNAGEDKIL